MNTLPTKVEHAVMFGLQIQKFYPHDTNMFIFILQVEVSELLINGYQHFKCIVYDNLNTLC